MRIRFNGGPLDGSEYPWECAFAPPGEIVATPPGEMLDANEVDAPPGEIGCGLVRNGERVRYRLDSGVYPNPMVYSMVGVERT